MRIWTSILWRQNTVAQFIATRQILGLCKGAVRRPRARVPMRWWEQTEIDWKGDREKAAAKEEEAAEAAEPELTGSDLETKADTPEGTACGTREEASLGASGSSGSGWRINFSSGDIKQEQRSIFKSNKEQSLESNIFAALVLEHHRPIMSKLWGLGDQTYRQTENPNQPKPPLY